MIITIIQAHSRCSYMFSFNCHSNPWSWCCESWFAGSELRAQGQKCPWSSSSSQGLIIHRSLDSTSSALSMVPLLPLLFLGRSWCEWEPIIIPYFYFNPLPSSDHKLLNAFVDSPFPVTSNPWLCSPSSSSSLPIPAAPSLQESLLVVPPWTLNPA